MCSTGQDHSVPVPVLVLTDLQYTKNKETFAVIKFLLWIVPQRLPLSGRRKSPIFPVSAYQTDNSMFVSLRVPPNTLSVAAVPIWAESSICEMETYDEGAEVI